MDSVGYHYFYRHVYCVSVLYHNVAIRQLGRASAHFLRNHACQFTSDDSWLYYFMAGAAGKALSNFRLYYRLDFYLFLRWRVKIQLPFHPQDETEKSDQ